MLVLDANYIAGVERVLLNVSAAYRPKCRRIFLGENLTFSQGCAYCQDLRQTSLWVAHCQTPTTVKGRSLSPSMSGAHAPPLVAASVGSCAGQHPSCLGSTARIHGCPSPEDGRLDRVAPATRQTRCA